MKRKAYHTYVKACYALGIHEFWLPKEITQNINPSTSYAWKNDDPTRFIGYDHVDRISKNMEEVQTIYKKAVAREKQMFIAYCRFKITIVHFIGKENFYRILQENKIKTVHLIQKLTDSFGKLSTACKHIGVRPNTYHYWKDVAYKKCESS